MDNATVKNDKRVISAWAMFDWANSAYNLVITTTVFPVYYTAITQTTAHGDQVQFFGRMFINTALANYSLSFAYLLMVLILPILSALADNRGNQKTFMKAFTYLGGLSCMCLFFFQPDNIELGIICSALAAMGYIGGVLLNNSFLPQIASTDQQDKVSAQGFAYGYIGSVLLQLICFLFILKPQWFGISDATLPPRISFLLVGIWWIGFSQIPFGRLPEKEKRAGHVAGHALKDGFRELAMVWKHIQGIPTLKRFLLAFFFYAMGVQTVMLVAAGFGEKILKLGQAKLIATILVIQLVATLGALLMSRLVRVFGNIRVIILMVLLWIVVCVSAYSIQTEAQFFGLAALVGLVMGGIQSISRSTYSKLLPANLEDTASFFSFYDVTEKMAIVLGLFSFAFIEELTHNMRYSALWLTTYFVVGLVFLVIIQAGNSRRKKMEKRA
ncbi:MFS transporter, UMF1 family [bacterium A37T11]|nr:MFS transporter, UMF1 family [bacterium A37T11]